MNEMIDKAIVIDKFNSFINLCVFCESDNESGYIIGIQKTDIGTIDIEILQEANIIDPYSNPAGSSEFEYFHLQPFPLLKIGYKFYATFDEFIKHNTYTLRNKISGNNVDIHYIYEHKASIPQLVLTEEPVLTGGLSLLYDNLFTVYALNNVLYFASDDNTSSIETLKVIEYTFFEKKKITVSSQISTIKIINLKLDDRKIIFDLFTELKEQNGNDRKIRLVFFKSALEKVCDTCKEVDMDFIIDNLTKIASEYHSNYRAYLNSLDPSKLRIDFEKGSQEFAGKLNSALSDIHGKIILIPIAVIAAIYQTSREHPIRNLALAAAVLIVVWVIVKFSDTQKMIIEQIKINIIDFRDLYTSEAKDYSSFSSQIHSKSTSMIKLADEVKDKIDLSKNVGYLGGAIVAIGAIWAGYNEDIISIWCFFTQCQFR